ncbi:hypothetical protein PInf_022182 [Phytophthora infestans]|nr:hypothetical protein PInf_022182 [Phytophthora infestans]
MEDVYEENTFNPGKGVCCALRDTDHAPTCDFVGPIYLCVKQKWLESSKTKNCWDIWHKVYKNGKAILKSMKGKFRVRGPKTTGSPGKSPAKHRRVNTRVSEDSEDYADSA